MNVTTFGQCFWNWSILRDLLNRQSTVSSVHNIDQAEPQHQFPQDQPIRIVLPLKDQRSADAVQKDLSELSKKIGSDLRPVFTSRKTIDDIKGVEVKPPLINQHCVVYKF